MVRVGLRTLQTTQQMLQAAIEMEKFIETQDASQHEAVLKPGTTWRNRPLQPHQVICLEAGTIIEVSTPDSVEDNYRVLPGDSQA